MNKPGFGKIGAIFLAYFLVLLSGTVFGADMNSLSDHRWSNRLILVQQAPETEGAVSSLQGAQAGIKSREPTLNLQAIFRRIDAMPMRIREMQSD